MNPFFWIAIAVFVIVDVAAVTFVLRRVRPLISALRIPDANQRQELFAATEVLVGSHLGAGSDGDPARLGAAVGTLLPELRGLWQSRGVDLDLGTCKTIVEMIAAKRGIASRKDLKAALATVT